MIGDELQCLIAFLHQQQFSLLESTLTTYIRVGCVLRLNKDGALASRRGPVNPGMGGRLVTGP